MHEQVREEKKTLEILRQHKAMYLQTVQQESMQIFFTSLQEKKRIFETKELQLKHAYESLKQQEEELFFLTRFTSLATTVRKSERKTRSLCEKEATSTRRMEAEKGTVIYISTISFNVRETKSSIKCYERVTTTVYVLAITRVFTNACTNGNKTSV